MALEQYAEAARAAIIIAKEDQTAGNYRAARNTLLTMQLQLQRAEVRVPSEMARSLVLLHSYVIVKSHIKRNDHENAARMLIRVSNSISHFPATIVNIVTSTVVECWKAGLKASAFSFAAMLMRPEYRPQIEPKYKSKLEKIVRKAEKDEPEEQTSPCPVCSAPVARSTLSCGACDSTLPFCAVTGYHMAANDWCDLPCCGFPALLSAAAPYVEAELACPMCESELAPGQIVQTKDTAKAMRKYQHDKKEVAGSGGLDVDV